MLLRKLLGAQGYKTVKKGIWGDHPIFAAGLGICSALAVSNKVENAIAMGAGVTFVLVATAVIVSSLRSLIPQRVRIITYMITIASFVIIVDKFLQAFFPGISEAVGPYVGLIITNCIFHPKQCVSIRTGCNFKRICLFLYAYCDSCSP
jgi:Na+-transporting NADH:ubiquinone oxidoreductase subunit NqrD